MRGTILLFPFYDEDAEAQRSWSACPWVHSSQSQSQDGSPGRLAPEPESSQACLLIGMPFFLMVLLVASLLMGVQDSLGETMKVS